MSAVVMVDEMDSSSEAFSFRPRPYCMLMRVNKRLVCINLCTIFVQVI